MVKIAKSAIIVVALSGVSIASHAVETANQAESSKKLVQILKKQRNATITRNVITEKVAHKSLETLIAARESNLLVKQSLTTD